MKTSLFTVMGILALAGLGATTPVAQGGERQPGSLSDEEIEKTHPRGRGGTGGTRSGGGINQAPLFFYCKIGDRGEVGNICDQCKGTPILTPSCAPAQPACKVKDESCFTEQKCQEMFGQEAKLQRCGAPQNPAFPNAQILSSNVHQHDPEGGEIGS
ncbi:hypothetical protein IWZ03DRAFT_28484 [Phyllosticta citriasiana]|uniref:Uncharacterized protein n=2 Tax=Phyllosticta citriasiana TaxID=595635 RepID=A0ABR1L4M3_9PEZI